MFRAETSGSLGHVGGSTLVVVAALTAICASILVVMAPRVRSALSGDGRLDEGAARDPRAVSLVPSDGGAQYLDKRRHVEGSVPVAMSPTVRIESTGVNPFLGRVRGFARDWLRGGLRSTVSNVHSLLRNPLAHPGMAAQGTLTLLLGDPRSLHRRFAATITTGFAMCTFSGVSPGGCFAESLGLASTVALAALGTGTVSAGLAKVATSSGVPTFGVGDGYRVFDGLPSEVRGFSLPRGLDDVPLEGFAGGRAFSPMALGLGFVAMRVLGRSDGPMDLDDARRIVAKQMDDRSWMLKRLRINPPSYRLATGEMSALPDVDETFHWVAGRVLEARGIEREKLRFDGVDRLMTSGDDLTDVAGNLGLSARQRRAWLTIFGHEQEIVERLLTRTYDNERSPWRAFMLPDKDDTKRRTAPTVEGMVRWLFDPERADDPISLPRLTRQELIWTSLLTDSFSPGVLNGVAPILLTARAMNEIQSRGANFYYGVETLLPPERYAWTLLIENAEQPGGLLDEVDLAGHTLRVAADFGLYPGDREPFRVDPLSDEELKTLRGALAARVFWRIRTAHGVPLAFGDPLTPFDFVRRLEDEAIVTVLFGALQHETHEHVQAYIKASSGLYRFLSRRVDEDSPDRAGIFFVLDPARDAEAFGFSYDLLEARLALLGAVMPGEEWDWVPTAPLPRR